MKKTFLISILFLLLSMGGKPALAKPSAMQVCGVVLATSALWLTYTTWESTTVPAHDVRRLNSPDFFQMDPKFNLIDGGESCCVPVSLANGLAWLASNGYPQLLPAASEVKMAKRLENLCWEATPNDEFAGLWVEETCVALHRYLAEQGIEHYELKLHGWTESKRGPHNIALYTDVSPISFNWLKRAMRHKSSVVWLDLTAVESHDEGLRIFQVGVGHAVTLVGFGKNELGEEDPNMFIIQDPGTDSRNGEPRNEYYEILPADEQATLILVPEDRREALPLDVLHSITLRNQHVLRHVRTGQEYLLKAALYLRLK